MGGPVDSWAWTFTKSFFSGFSVSTARLPGESFKQCVSRVRAAGGSATTAVDAVSGVGLLTGSFGTTTTLVNAGRGAQGWNVTNTAVKTTPNLSIAEGVAYSAASKGLISPSAAGMFGKIVSPLGKLSAVAAAVGIGLEGGVLGACIFP
jgi:hypothetical protein